MYPVDAEKMVYDLMDHCGVSRIQWSFEFSNTKRSLGQCSSTKKLIRLSRYYVEHNSEDDIRNTILHELAHALVGCKEGHNHVWRAMAIRLGCSGDRLNRTAVMPKGNYTFTCPNGHTHQSYKLTNRMRNMSCGKCSSTFNPAYKFTITKYR